MVHIVFFRRNCIFAIALHIVRRRIPCLGNIFIATHTICQDFKAANNLENLACPFSLPNSNQSSFFLIYSTCLIQDFFLPGSVSNKSKFLGRNLIINHRLGYMLVGCVLATYITAACFATLVEYLRVIATHIKSIVKGSGSSVDSTMPGIAPTPFAINAIPVISKLRPATPTPVPMAWAVLTKCQYFFCIFH